MMGRTFKNGLLGCGIVALIGCAGSDDRYPSLAIRDSERFGGQLSPLVSPEPAVIAPVSQASISAALETAFLGNTQFLAAQSGASRLATAASGTSQDSDVRARALVALAQLVSLRGQTSGALASLDALEADAATTFAATDQIEMAQAKISEILATQNAAISEIELEMGL